MSYEAETNLEVEIINDAVAGKMPSTELVEKYPFRYLVKILDKVAKHPEYNSEKARRKRLECIALRPIEEYPELYV